MQTSEIKRIIAEGATVKNGDFTEAKDGKVVAWSLAKDAKYVDGGEGALAGKKTVMVWHNFRASQGLDVKAGRK